MIVKLKNGKWRLKSKAGKNLGTFDSREAAEKHEREVEYFKKQGTQNMKPSFKQLSVNLVGAQVRQDRMEGRDWIVVPMIMAVEGVLHGSDGPLFYPCLLYTSDAADDLLCVDLGGRRVIKNKTNTYRSSISAVHYRHSTVNMALDSHHHRAT